MSHPLARLLVGERNAVRLALGHRSTCMRGTTTMHSWCTAAALYALLPLPHESAHMCRRRATLLACACRCTMISPPLNSEPPRLDHVDADAERFAPRPASARLALADVATRLRRLPTIMPACPPVCTICVCCFVCDVPVQSCFCLCTYVIHVCSVIAWVVLAQVVILAAC